MQHGGSHSLSLGGRLARPVRAAWGAASKSFQRHPLLLKTVSSACGFGFGDVLSQLGTTRRKGQPLDWRRSAAMGAAGLVAAGPLGYAFIVWMEGNIMTTAPHSRLALVTKIALDQVLGLALWHATLAAINEPHREACMAWVPRPQPRQQQQQQQPGQRKQAQAASTAK